MEILEKWQSILKETCMQALSPEEKETSLILLRARRLDAWKELLIQAAAKELGEKEAAAFREEAGKKVGAVITLLTGAPGISLPKCREYKEVIYPVSPEKVPGIFLSALQMQFQGAEEYGFGDEKTLFTLFDGKRSIFDAAMVLWALRPFGGKEREEDLPEIAANFDALARQLLESGAYRLKEQPIVTKEDIIQGLRELGIREGDIVMTHSSLKGFGIVEGGAGTVIAALQSLVTEEGILAMPALSLTVDGGARKDAFDPAVTPIEPWVGIIPETFRNSPNVLRSNHPTHSVCAWGKGAQEFLASSAPLDVFAPDGPWGKLKEKGKILFLGESTTGNTFLHACEAWFGGYLDETMAKVKKEDGSVELLPVKNYPGGCRGGWYGLGRNAPYYKKLEAMGIFRETKIGNARITLASAPLLAEAVKGLLEEDPAIFLHKNGCPDCARIRGKIYWKDR